MTGRSARSPTLARWQPGVIHHATSPSSASIPSRCVQQQGRAQSHARASPGLAGGGHDQHTRPGAGIRHVHHQAGRSQQQQPEPHAADSLARGCTATHGRHLAWNGCACLTWVQAQPAQQQEQFACIHPWVCCWCSADGSAAGALRILMLRVLCCSACRGCHAPGVTSAPTATTCLSESLSSAQAAGSARQQQLRVQQQLAWSACRWRAHTFPAAPASSVCLVMVLRAAGEHLGP